MRAVIIVLFTLVGYLIASSSFADIYRWTDQNGVIHFTNYAPPKDATVIMKTEEVPYDEVADRQRMESERQQELELARLEIAEKQAEIEKRAAEAERRALEAERYAEETVREAEDYLKDVRNDRYYSTSYGYFGYYRPPHFRRWYYRNETGSIYFKKPQYKNPHKRHYLKRRHYGHHKKYYHHKHHPSKHFYQKGSLRVHKLHSRGKKFHGRSGFGYRGGYHGRRHMGRSR
jgi:hypothetical protein